MTRWYLRRPIKFTSIDNDAFRFIMNGLDVSNYKDFDDVYIFAPNIYNTLYECATDCLLWGDSYPSRAIVGPSLPVISLFGRLLPTKHPWSVLNRFVCLVPYLDLWKCVPTPSRSAIL